jgi:hypothetical protein
MPPPEQAPVNGSAPFAAMQDAVYGTRLHTQGAKYQIPRKVPLRIEPKTYFGESTVHCPWSIRTMRTKLLSALDRLFLMTS